MTNVMTIFLFPMVNLTILYSYYRKYKMNKNSLEFRSTLSLMIGFTIMSMMIILPQIELTLAMSLEETIYYCIGFLVVQYCVNVNVKGIVEKQETINNLVKDLNYTIKESSDMSLMVSNQTVELSASLNEINSSAEEISATTMEITDRIQSQANKFQEIQETIKDINKIIKTITNIAEQTNLLALNASIEAGRSGEHGRGFMVVADRVQQLAEISKKSVEETTDKVNTMKKEINSASSNISEIAIAMEEISASTEEQTASLEEINTTLSMLEENAITLYTKLTSKEEKEEEQETHHLSDIKKKKVKVND